MAPSYTRGACDRADGWVAVWHGRASVPRLWGRDIRIASSIEKCPMN